MATLVRWLTALVVLAAGLATAGLALLIEAFAEEPSSRRGGVVMLALGLATATSAIALVFSAYGVVAAAAALTAVLAFALAGGPGDGVELYELFALAGLAGVGLRALVRRRPHRAA
jgi:hypothetical protein